MKIRLFVALAAVLPATGLALSANFQATQSAAHVNFAAKCAISSFQKAYDASKAVFVGEVVDEEKDGDVRVFDFKVETYWKGIKTKSVKIHVYETMRFQAFFKKGGKYLIYAPQDEEGKLRIYRCSRSRDVEFAEEDLQKLGEGKIPR